jgi:hypothetical protein
MDIATWWGVIERARAAAGDRADDRDASDDPLPGLVADELRALDPAAIVSFGQHFRDVRNAAYTWPLWAAAYVIEGGCSDDGFLDFRAGLVLQGHDASPAPWPTRRPWPTWPWSSASPRPAPARSGASA